MTDKQKNHPLSTFGLMFLLILVNNGILFIKIDDILNRSTFSDPNSLSDIKRRRSLRGTHFDDQYVDDTNIEDLWLGKISTERLKYEYIQFKKPKVSLVVSHCDLPVDWIWNYFLQVGIKFESAHIYSKCDEPVKGAPPEATIVKLPNVGRNDHSFAYHMNHMNYTNRSDDEIVFFMKDNLHRLVNDDQFFSDTERRSMPKLMEITSVNGFGCFEQPRSLLNIYPSFYYDLETLNTYNNKEGYVRMDRDEETNVPFASEYDDFNDWINALDTTLQTPFVPVCMGGMFSATVAQIKKRKSVWGMMENKLSRGDNIEEGHFAERSWAGLLSKPLSPYAIDKLTKKKTHFLCDTFPWGDRCGNIVSTVNGSDPIEPEYPYYDDDDDEHDMTNTE